MVVGRRRFCGAILSWWVLAQAGVLAHGAAATFHDDGTPDSLRTALERARSAVPRSEARRRRLLDALVADLEAGRSVDAMVAARARRKSSVGILLTGYYEPSLTARRRRTERFRHPLFRVPEDASGRKLARARIDAGGLAGRGLELFWLDDPVESFFLHVQGSGRLRLGDGTTARVGYAGNNGHKYHSIGSELVSRGELTVKEATAPAIKQWLREHRGEMFEILHTNPRYIFFRKLDAPADVGPTGAMGVPLVPMRSVATDPAVAPMGSVGLLTAPMPDGSTLRRVVVAMDKGAGIQGETRIDLFTGADVGAENLAGVLRSRGRIIWLE